MTRRTTIEHRFVDSAPERLEEGVLYISIPFATALHKCCCGCSAEVVTKLSPAGWSVTFDGRSVSLYPSIGNWSLPCRSHYWIRKGRVEWARRWTEDEIAEVREIDRRDFERLFESEKEDVHSEHAARSEPTLFHRVKSWLFRDAKK